ncbi:MAG TPA: GAF domain-containing SpoIIE family protein phosphatase [Thermoanaerobaculia bacterium]|jgi:sigma-B regulation protein RsbU (phosphoserine phosphatase)
MHASSPLPSPPSPGSGASPSNVSASPATAAGGHRLLAAHARLAAIDPWSGRERLFEEILAALLLGSGASRGILLDPVQVARSAGAGVAVPEGALAGLAAGLGTKASAISPLAPPALRALFGGDVTSPFAVPITAQEDVLAYMILDALPEDPVGFASATAHTAWLLDTVRMSEKVQKADFELKYRVWELQSLYDVGLSIARTLDLESLSEDVLMTSVSLLNARSGSLLVRAQGDEGFFAKHVGEPLLNADAIYEVPAGAVLANARESRPDFLKDAPAEKLLLVPIAVENRALGVLVVADKETRGGGVDDFTEADVRVASLFANQAAIALENARLHREAVEKEKMEREMELAASIQKTILPDTLPEVTGLTLAGANRPTKQVGGDYFDVYPLPGGLTALCVADVSGKGVPAALLVSTVHACLHLLIANLSGDLPALVARVNKHLVRFSSTRKFATLFVAVFDPATGLLRYVNAGHNPGLWLSSSGATLLPSGGVPVGMMPAAVHREAAVTLGPGDTLLLYSDGITEALNRDDEEFGMDRLTELALEGRGAPPGELSRRIFGAVSDFTAGVAQYDDQTVLIARVAGA